MAEPAPTTSPLVRRYDIDEFFALDAPPGGGHWELIAGVLYMVPPPKPAHAYVVSRLVEALVSFTVAHPGVGRVFVPQAAVWNRGAATYLEPDVFVVSAAHVARVPDEGFVTADLVVEVSSPGTALYDRTAKADTYAALGVRELWLVDLEARAVERRTLAGQHWGAVGIFGEADTLHSASFPGLSLAVGAIFADLSR
jgi:Uma2 family endonuclease